MICSKCKKEIDKCNNCGTRLDDMVYCIGNGELHCCSNACTHTIYESSYECVDVIRE